MDDLDHTPSKDSRQAHERQLFDAIATRYCRKDLLPASQRARRLRLEQTVRYMPLSSTTELLEVGCGAGFSASYLKGRYGSYVGIDQSKPLIDLARTYNASDMAQFHFTDIAMYKPDKCFDAIFMIGVLHHLTHPVRILNLIADWLTPNGWLVVNESQPANPLFSYARRVRKRIHKDYSSEQEEMSAEQLTGMFTKAGLCEVFLAPQGLFSTPFAEVIVRPLPLARVLAVPACALDRILEKVARPVLQRLSWNLIAGGRRAPA